MRSALQAKRGLVDALVTAVVNATDHATPFHHITFNNVFPDDCFQRLLAALPSAADYRPMSGRAKATDLPDGKPTRVKIDLFPEYVRALPPHQRTVWGEIGRALCAPGLQAAFVERLAPGLARRFGPDFRNVDLFPIPVLTSDIAGYRIAPHTDTRWKAITVLLFLPRDAAIRHAGTVVHARAADGSLRRADQIDFAPNSGFAFAVGDDSWHSVDPVGPEVATRDLIILQYFVDAGMLRFLRNRSKRIGNFLLNETRRRMASERS